MEVPRCTPIHGTFLELGILPNSVRDGAASALLFVKDENDPVMKVYEEMFKYNTERNWANMAM